ncbi:hypothetical protein ANANG_G00194560 [Anguilla anguilla]|uniref:PH and SEC7 domain-containing protein 4-like n=1 Tax=Anguilla anguilla TaxID=7936 RepID=A0A9D3M8P8_ANGAN|nr:hypothetical protein ANANG_G00194560 [Anguilla anguilla]
MEEDQGCVSDLVQQESNSQGLQDPRAPLKCQMSDRKPENGGEEDGNGLYILNEARQITGNGASVDTGLLTRPCMSLSPCCECPTLAVHFAVSGNVSCDELDSSEGASLDMYWTDLSLPPSHLHPPYQMKEGDKTALTEKNILMENYFQGSPPPGTYSSDGPEQDSREEEPPTNSQEEDGLTRGELKDVKAFDPAAPSKELLTGESHKATEGTRQEPTTHSGVNVMAAESQALIESMETPSPSTDGQPDQEHQPLDCHAEWTESAGITESSGGSTAELTPVCSAATNPRAGSDLVQLNCMHFSDEYSIPITSVVALKQDTVSSEMDGIQGKEVTCCLNGYEEGMKEEEEEEEKKEEDRKDHNNLLHKVNFHSQCTREKALPVQTEEAESNHRELHEHTDQTVLLNWTEHPEQSEESGQQQQLEQIQKSEEGEQAQHTEQSEQLDQTEETEQPEQTEQSEKKQPVQTEQAEHPEQMEQPEQMENPEQIEQPGQVEQPEQLEQPEQMEQPVQMEQLDQLEQTEQMEHPEKMENPEQIEQSGQVEQPEQLEQPEQMEQPVQMEQLDQLEQTEQMEHPEQIEQSGQVEQPEQLEQPEQMEQPVQMEQLDQLEQTEQMENPEKMEDPEQIEQSGQVEQPEQLEQLEQPEQMEQPVQMEQTDQLEQTEQMEHPEKMEQLVQMDQPEQMEPSGQMEQPQQLEWPEQTEQAVQMEQSDQSERPVQMERPEKMEQLVQIENPKQLEQSGQIEQLDHLELPEHVEKPVQMKWPEQSGQFELADQSIAQHKLGLDNTEHAKKILKPLPTQQTEEQKWRPIHHNNKGSMDREEAHRLAEKLYKLQDVRRTDVVKYLNKDNEFSHTVGEEYLKFFEFTGQSLNQGLRSFLKVVVLIGETQERERVLEHFSHRFHQCNPDSFSSPSAVLTLTCALMLLNTDLHGQNVGKSMSISTFVSNLDGMNEGEHFCKNLLKDLYNGIKNEPLEWAVDEEELKSSVLQQDEKADPLLRSKSNPFQDLPHDKKAMVYKQGFLTRKAHADIDGKRTPWGKRSWKTFYAVLKGMVLYLQKDEYNIEWQNSAEVVSVHHALAERADDYTKRPHVFRLQTADWRVFLFQASTLEHMSSWINRINLVSALYSSPPFPAAVGSQKRFSRPILPAMQSALTLEKQLQSHSRMLDSFSTDLTFLQQSVLEGRRAKARELEERRQREEYLLHEKSRYEVYKQMLEVWKGLGGHIGGAVRAVELERFDEELYVDTEEEEAGLKKSHSSPSLNLELAPPPIVKVKRNISERRTYRKIIIPRRNREL